MDGRFADVCEKEEGTSQRSHADIYRGHLQVRAILSGTKPKSQPNPEAEDGGRVQGQGQRHGPSDVKGAPLSIGRAEGRAPAFQCSVDGWCAAGIRHARASQ